MNKKWFFDIYGFLPLKNKEVLFVPCASAFKTREQWKDKESGKIYVGRKWISNGQTHQTMSTLIKNPLFDCIIESEPCVIIPKRLEAYHPDYNVPVECLSVQGELTFIERLGSWLNYMKREQPKRKYIYFFGATHHYFILQFANIFARKPFEILFRVPKGGKAYYGKEAKIFLNEIKSFLNGGKKPQCRSPNLENHLTSRNRYTNLPILVAEILMQVKAKRRRENPIFEETRVDVCTIEEYFTGFSHLYPVSKNDNIKMQKLDLFTPSREITILDSRLLNLKISVLRSICKQFEIPDSQFKYLKKSALIMFIQNHSKINLGNALTSLQV